MWRFPISFITLHYAWIVCMSLLGLLVIAPYGNVSAIDAFFFGASASTESGLNPVNVNDLKTSQQLYLYFSPMFTNLGFINIAVVVVRLYWFEQRLKDKVLSIRNPLSPSAQDLERAESKDEKLKPGPTTTTDSSAHALQQYTSGSSTETDQQPVSRSTVVQESNPSNGIHISFPEHDNLPRRVLHVPGPRERDQGEPFEERDNVDDDDDDAIRPAYPGSILTRRRTFQMDNPGMSTARSIERVASSFFAPGGVSQGPSMQRRSMSRELSSSELPGLSRAVTVGRNSRFYDLTAEDRERLGGIEYRALKLLIKILPCYYFGLHLFGAICLVPWIHRAPSKYTDYLAECGQGLTWWGFYSAQTMVDNLGFTLTPDSMIQFNDAAWPLLVMTFLAFAGNTLYPCFLRLVIWTMSKLVPKNSATRDTLNFILDHPRRVYTLLFPSRPTWILFGIIFTLNFTDVLLIVLLDLKNPAVNDLALGPRILAAIFQAASSRHTGTATFNLADVNPAVQFSLLVMMYIAVLPIAISIRSSNTYEEDALGKYEHERRVDESKGSTYIMTHIQNQLTFDLWYIFLGTFCICIAEAGRIMDPNDPAFAVFPIFFEVVSGYGNVGLSLGYPTDDASLSGQFNIFSKIVMCLMMIRGRHRGLPHALDRAIMLPGDRPEEFQRVYTDDVKTRHGE